MSRVTENEKGNRQGLNDDLTNLRKLLKHVLTLPKGKRFSVIFSM